jgi:iron complex outermembrane receptor protein
MNLSSGRSFRQKWRDNTRNVARLAFILAFGWSAILVGRAQERPQVDLTQVTLEDLMNVNVTSVSRREQKLARAATAVFVISQQDIRRSGATSIPDLLRMVPGLEVAQINSNTWAITSRGFNGQFSNKLLVLIDGRTGYDPSFSGVYWDVQDTLLDDIERIEVIRGPGATIWGSNAVNGVINIITRSAKDSAGGLVTTNVGNTEQGGSARYGGKIGQHANYRVFENM